MTTLAHRVIVIHSAKMGWPQAPIFQHHLALQVKKESLLCAPHPANGVQSVHFRSAKDTLWVRHGSLLPRMLLRQTEKSNILSSVTEGSWCKEKLIDIWNGRTSESEKTIGTLVTYHKTPPLSWRLAICKHLIHTQHQQGTKAPSVETSSIFWDSCKKTGRILRGLFANVGWTRLSKNKAAATPPTPTPHMYIHSLPWQCPTVSLYNWF